MIEEIRPTLTLRREPKGRIKVRRRLVRLLGVDLAMSDLEDEFEQAQDLDEDWDDEDATEGYENTSFVCEDCDYRWDELAAEEVDETSMVCPMCGSVNITLI